jgi:5-methylcytosine-specific restriction endonuclease McrA
MSKRVADMTPEERLRKREYDRERKPLTEEQKARKREQARAWFEANRERALETTRAYREANRERAREITRAWRAANPERQRENNRAWREANRERANDTNRANRERRRETDRAWREANRERVNETGLARFHRRRARLKDSCSPGVSPEQWSRELEIARRRCEYCGRSGVKLTRDHIHPIALGGRDEPDNITVACALCNSAKHKKTFAEWIAYLEALAARDALPPWFPKKDAA